MAGEKPEKKKPTRRKKGSAGRAPVAAGNERKGAGAQAPASSSVRGKAPAPSAEKPKAAPQSPAAHETASAVANEMDDFRANLSWLSSLSDSLGEVDQEARRAPSGPAPKPGRPDSAGVAGVAVGDDADAPSWEGDGLKAGDAVAAGHGAVAAEGPCDAEAVEGADAAQATVAEGPASRVVAEDGAGATPTPVRKRTAEKAKGAKRSTVVLTIVALVIVALVAGFVSLRWLIHDDAQLIQGEWCVEASQETLVFDDHQMKLTKSVTYEYSLDTFDKTITYFFANLTGEANYYFSLDGQQLIITEGEAPNILIQLGLMPNPAIAVDTVDDAVIVLTKISDNVDAKPAAKVKNNSTEEADTVGADIVAGKQDAAKDDSAGASGDAGSDAAAGSGGDAASGAAGAAGDASDSAAKE